ncbi:MAG: SDR family oxidoreductase [Gammaproteobacteria bacterium]|nr:SDR family oxidoreductase [Gammaproteobacteria bacterium]
MQKTVLITGSSAGFGRAATQHFVKQGDRVIACARRLARLQELQQQLGETNVLPILLDVTDTDQIASLSSQIPAAWQAIDVLVNNAGLALGTNPAQTAELDDWDSMIDTNIKGLVHLTRHILPGMLERGRGHIINIGSIAGDYPYPGGNTYGASKAFVKQFSLNLLADLVDTPIRVTNIEPGAAETEFSIVRYHGDKHKADKVYAGMSPLTADDIAECITWAANQPAHVNINRIEVMPTNQASAGVKIHRQPD